MLRSEHAMVDTPSKTGIPFLRRSVLFVLLFVAACGGATAPIASEEGLRSNVEDQRKYVFPKGRSMPGELIAATDIDGFKITHHSDYDYLDIYLDTDEFVIFKNELSLRFRKRNLDDGQKTYDFQLKSEKKDAADNRLEVDFKEFSAEEVKIDGTTSKLVTFLDPLFDMAENGEVKRDSKVFKHGVDAIGKWLSSDSGNASPPVVELKKYIKDYKVKLLKPSVLGKSNRARFHVYADGAPSANPGLNGIAPNQYDPAGIPDFFKQPGHTRYVWLLEASYDSSNFVSAMPSRKKTTTVEQFEVENKYRPLNKGKDFLNAFERGLKKAFGSKSVVESKYAASVREFYEP